jgi:hypothetical protein
MPLPDAFQQWLREAFIATGFNATHVRTLALMQLAQWRKGEAKSAIPGYAAPPPNATGKAAPEGWTIAAFQRLCAEGKSAAKLIRAGTRRTTSSIPA